MAISAHLETSDHNGDAARGEARRTISMATRGITPSGNVTQLLVHNVSATGLLIQGDLDLAEGDRLEVELPHAGTSAARVIWASGKLYGCQFDEPISDAALSAAQLRSAVDQDMELAAQQSSMLEESFAARLHRLRNARGLTLDQLAALLSVSKPTVWAWEQGRARPVEARINALAEALDVPSSQLQPGRDNPVLARLISRCREQIAETAGVSAEKIRIMIEL